MARFRTLGSNTWAVDDGDKAYRVWRTRGSDSNDQPSGWVWSVQVWRGSTMRTRQHWHTLPRYGLAAKRIAGIVERMLAEVR